MSISKEERARLKSLGLCTYCKGEKKDKSKSMCESCREKKRKYQAKRMEEEEYAEKTREMQKRSMRKRFEKGICRRCKNPLDGCGVLCNECNQKSRVNGAETRAFYKSIGVCKCGKYKLLGQEKTCPECRANSANAMSIRRLDEDFREKCRKKRKALSESYKSKGLCSRCGGNLDDKSKVTCRKCRLYNSTHNNRLNKGIPQRVRWEYGICTCCSNPIEDGYKVCKKCHERLTEMARSNPKVIANRDKFKAEEHKRYENYMKFKEKQVNEQK